ncbi:MAG TPA: hypothetical protein VGF67_32325 [Ktedonobacteraceae bacterium]|jgi:hypothetical protein
MKDKQAEHRPIDVYRRLILLLFSGLFVVLTFAYLLIDSPGHNDASTWPGYLRQLLHDAYPNILIIPCTVLCSYLFFRPISRADQSEQEKQFLEKMRQTLVPVLEEKLTANMKELLVPLAQTTLVHALPGFCFSARNGHRCNEAAPEYCRATRSHCPEQKAGRSLRYLDFV